MWTRRARSTRRRTAAAGLAVALAAGVTALTAAPATAAEGEIGTWGVRQSYRNYINGPIAHGEVEVGGGVVWLEAPGNGKGPFTWPVADATFNEATGSGTVNFEGSVAFRGHKNTSDEWIMELELADLTLDIDGDEAVLSADLTYRPFVAADPNLPAPPQEQADDAPFASIDLSGEDLTLDGNGAFTIDAAPAVGVAETMELIGWDQFYGTSTPDLDPFSTTVTPELLQPTMQLSTDQVFATGGTVTVSGSGFDPAANIGTRPPLAGQPAGFYVTLGDFDTTWQPSTGAPGTSRRVIKDAEDAAVQIWVVPQASYDILTGAPWNVDPAGLAVLDPDGTFTTDLVVDSTAAANGRAATANLGVYLYPGSGATNADNELSAPLSIASPEIGLSTSTLDPYGSTVTVTGSGFDPAANIGTRPPLAGQPAGFYVTLGDFDTTWQPSTGAPGTSRRVIKDAEDAAVQIWVVPQASYDILTGAPWNVDPAGLAVLDPDGTFTTDLVVDSTAAANGRAATANLGVYLYPGSGATNAEHELTAPVTVGSRTANESFVHATRVDFLDDDPTRPEIATGVARLGQVGKTRYLQELSTSDEWLRAIVDRFYNDTLGRPADPAGAAHWIGKLRNGTPVAEVAATFYSSAEYFRKYGDNDLNTWISDLYPKLMGRAVDPAGLTYWRGQAQSKGRTNVALRLYQSPETARARVRSLYQDLLGRAPDAAGLTYWAGRVVTHGDLALAVSLASSGEYQNRANLRFP